LEKYFKTTWGIEMNAPDIKTCPLYDQEIVEFPITIHVTCKHFGWGKVEQKLYTVEKPEDLPAGIDFFIVQTANEDLS
jgi:hypothetical protein